VLLLSADSPINSIIFAEDQVLTDAVLRYFTSSTPSNDLSCQRHAHDVTQG